MHSFDAVFSEKGIDGNPLSICDPVTGAVNKKCFEHWEQYDISNFLKNHWSSLKTSLKGKIRITVGNQDNFMLDVSVHGLEREMTKLNADIVFAYYPGDHFTVATPKYKKEDMQFLGSKILEINK